MTTTLQQAATVAKEKMNESNPTVASGKTRAERQRIPLSVPVRKLEVPPIPGYHLRWMRGTVQRLAAAERAGFTFVTTDEVDINNTLLGGDATQSGNTDMGSRVSISEGGEVENGQAVRLYLMKQPMEFYLEDRGILNKRNDSIAASLTAQYQTGQVGGRADGEAAGDAQHRYVDQSRSRLPDIFRKKS